MLDLLQCEFNESSPTTAETVADSESSDKKPLLSHGLWCKVCNWCLLCGTVPLSCVCFSTSFSVLLSSIDKLPVGWNLRSHFFFLTCLCLHSILDLLRFIFFHTITELETSNIALFTICSLLFCSLNIKLGLTTVKLVALTGLNHFTRQSHGVTHRW